MEWPRGGFGFRILAAVRFFVRPVPSRSSRSAASCRMRSFVTPSALAVARREGYGVSILTFFTDPTYAAAERLVNSPGGHLGRLSAGRGRGTPRSRAEAFPERPLGRSPGGRRPPLQPAA